MGKGKEGREKEWNESDRMGIKTEINSVYGSGDEP